jgi:hypothetical protein
MLLLQTTYKLADGNLLCVDKEDWPAWIANDFPLVLRFSPGTLYRYASGIDNPDRFDGLLQHSIALVGIRAQGEDVYYVLRNSFGPNWDENGHYYISANSSTIMPKACSPSGPAQRNGL